jgi:hypothetical protein
LRNISPFCRSAGVEAISTLREFVPMEIFAVGSEAPHAESVAVRNTTTTKRFAFTIFAAFNRTFMSGTLPNLKTD